MDRRLEILAKEGARFPLGFPPEMKSAFYNAMDEYFTERALELLEYVGRKTKWPIVADGEVFFWDGREYLSKNQLFENFL